MTLIKVWYTALTALMLVSTASCAQAPRNFEHPHAYDLNNPETFYLWDVLHEISGITFPERASNRVYAIEDETGTLYRFQPGAQLLEESKFHKKGDYEGIALSKGRVIVLRSDGRLYSFDEPDNFESGLGDTEEWTDLVPKAEYEGLAALPDGSLFLLCKKCDVDKKADRTSGYELHLDDSGKISKVGDFSVDHQQIEKFMSLNGKDFRPSALSKNQSTGEWYILSSVNQMLVIADQQFQVREVFPLDPKLYNQPEGLAFDHAGNLYISNEGGDQSRKGTILKIKKTP